jgi:hypothetical protein
MGCVLSVLAQSKALSATTKPVLTLITSIAKAVVAERFGLNAKDKPDMMGSFVRHGLSQKEAEAEALVQMYVKP